jgi:glycosidase
VVAVLCALTAQASDLFLGPMPVQFVSPGSSLTLDLHRFYQATQTSRFQTAGAKDLQVSFNRKTLELQIRLESGAHGLIDLPFQVEDGQEARQGVITLAVRSPQGHEFVYHSRGKPVKVNVAGSFNGWSKDTMPLRADENGVFRAIVPLGAGSYTYKFIVDGQWTPDESDPLRESDGFGGNNSVLKVDAGGKGGSRFSIYADQLGPDQLIVRSAGSGEISSTSVVAEFPDGSTRTVPVSATSSELKVPLAGLPPGTWVRAIAANATDRASNVVRCSLGERDAFRWQDAIMYYALTDRFCDGDKSNDHPIEDPNVQLPANYHGGDWRGIEDKIRDGYFKKLGINTVWIAPLNKNPQVAYREYPEPHRWYTGYHGYWPISPTEVEPHFGDARALKSLIKTAHENGLKVIADLVLHHVHTEHPWWKEHRDWFGTLELPDGTKNLRRWDDYQFTTWFEPFMPTFDFANPAAVTALIDNSAWWANEYDLDGFRLDAVKHIPPEFWWKFRVALREKVEAKRDRPLYLVGETFKDRAGIDSFVGPNMLDGQFDFPLYDSIKDCLAENKGGLDQLEAAVEESEGAFGKESLMSPLIGNHDKGRFMAYADGELPDAKGAKEEEVGWARPPAVDDAANYARLELAQALVLAIDGVPMIYYGDEFGMTGAGDPDNRRDMRFGNDLSVPERAVLENFEKLTRIRTRHSALRYGSRRTLLAEKEVLAFVRAQLGDRMLCVFNRGPKTIEREFLVGPELSDGSYIDEMGGTIATVKDKKVTVKIAPGSAAFFGKAP